MGGELLSLVPNLGLTEDHHHFDFQLAALGQWV
jgi:hypothetical protein